MIKLTCDKCLKEYEVYPSTAKWNILRGRKNKFCSNKCRIGYFVGQNHSTWVGGRYIAPNGYVRIQCSEEKCGYRYEHRIVIEKYIGRRLKKGEQIHHLNEIKHDNRIENLRLVSSSEHKKFHPNGKGENGTYVKLTQKQVDKIRKKYSTGKYTQQMLADEYKVTFQNISRIILFKSWKVV